MKICKDAGYCHSDEIKKGDKIGLGGKYFLSSCSLMIEVALKLGHTLWRKIFPEEIPDSDTNLHITCFDFLQFENYKLSIIIGEFAFNLPNISSDLDRKINIVNYSIALKFGGHPDKAKEILPKIDWSATSNDFKIAETVLNDRFDDAAIIMERIGKGGDLVRESSYHDWPLFKEFRESDQFKNAYEKTFGFSFKAELERAAEKAEEEYELEAEFEAIGGDTPNNGAVPAVENDSAPEQ